MWRSRGKRILPPPYLSFSSSNHRIVSEPCWGCAHISSSSFLPFLYPQLCLSCDFQGELLHLFLIAGLGLFQLFCLYTLRSRCPRGFILSSLQSKGILTNDCQTCLWKSNLQLNVTCSLVLPNTIQVDNTENRILPEISCPWLTY